MFNIFKKEVTPEVYGHQLWLFCCDRAEEFFHYFRPKLQESGYLKSPSEDIRFREETMHLHIWIISCALGAENSKILDVVNNYAMDFIIEQQGKQVSIRDRYALYYNAYSKDMEDIQIKGTAAWPSRMGKAALQCLVNYNSVSSDFIETEVELTILDTMNAVRKMRSEIKIK